MKRTTLILAVALTLFVAATAPGLAHAGGYTHTRDGMVYGFNAGWGWARAEAYDAGNSTAIKTDWFDDITGGVRVGFAPDDQWVYGLDFSGWSDASQNLDETIFWILADLRYFPGGQGLYVHGNAGMGTMNLSYNSPAAMVTKSAGGFAWGFGAGYEARITPTFALGLSYDYRQVSMGEVSILEDVATTVQGATLAFTWYSE
jgi:opacity protein-like surface antigen